MNKIIGANLIVYVCVYDRIYYDARVRAAKDAINSTACSFVLYTTGDFTSAQTI